MLNEESAISLSLNFTICVSTLFKEIATLTPTFAFGGMMYCSVSHGRGKAMILQVGILDQVLIIRHQVKDVNDKFKSFL